MRIHVFPSPRALLRSFLLTAAAASLLVLGCLPSRAQEDPPAQAGRLSIITGTVSIQPAGSDDWNQAELNWPIGPGDRIFTDNDGRAEIQLGQTFFRIGPNSDVTLTEDTASSIAVGVAQGAVHVRCQGLWQGQSLHLDTPSGSATLDQPGEMRVDVFTGEQAAIFTPLAGQIAVNGAGNYYQEVYTGQALELAGSNPVYPQWLEPAAADSLDLWSARRDRQIARAASFSYVSPEIPGAEELDLYGTWRPASEYGPVWFPNNMPAGWAPYHYGHWVSHDPWGWVWVEEEPWGYAPFHYGRWVNYHGRWGWIPGPREAHPVWSPALVVFAGGVQSGGFGLSAWFPLGPGEPYRPWYRCSPSYIDQVNITNITESPRVRVQKTYVNINITNINYVNRTSGLSAMRENDFAAGRPVRQVAVQIDVRALDRSRIQASPQVQPNPRLMAPNRPLRAVPVQANRPTLINQKGMAVVAKPNAQPQAVPMRAAPVVRTLPGRTVVAPPSTARGASGRGNGAQPASGGSTTQPGNRQWPQTTNQTNQPGARQPQGGSNAIPASGPSGNPASPSSGPAANPAAGQSGQPANQTPSRPAAGAQPASGGAAAEPAKPATQPASVPQTTNQPAARQPQGSGSNQPENRQWPQTTNQTNQPGAANQPGARQPQGSEDRAAPQSGQSGMRPSQGSETRPGAGAAPAANSPAQPNAKPSPQDNKQANQKQGEKKQNDQKQEEKEKKEQEKQ